MWRTFLYVLLISSGRCVMGQQPVDSLREEKTPSKLNLFFDRQQDIGIFMHINYGLHPQPEKYGPNGQVEFGALFNKWQFGLFYEGYDGEFFELLVFPTQFTLAYEYAGASLGRRIWTNDNWAVFGNFSYAYGFVEWIANEGFGGTFARDRFSVFQPAVQVETLGLRWLRVTGRIGYKINGDFNLPQLSPGDLDGFFGMVGMKLGFYKRRRR